MCLLLRLSSTYFQLQQWNPLFCRSKQKLFTIAFWVRAEIYFTIRAMHLGLSTALVRDRKKGWEGHGTANPVTCTSLRKSMRWSEWPWLIHLSADTSKNIIRAPAKTHQDWDWVSEWMHLPLNITTFLFLIHPNLTASTVELWHNLENHHF